MPESSAARPRTELSVDLASMVSAVVAAHRDDRGPLLQILHDLQATLGYVPPEALPMLAKELNISRADVYGVVTFYRDFRDRPDARHVVRVCGAEACQSRGGEHVAEHVRQRFGVDFGEITADGSVRLEEVFCLGLCAIGPNIEVDGNPRAAVSTADIDTLVSALR